MSETTTNPKYVKIRIEDEMGNVLLHHFLRIDSWGLPAGRIEEGETPRTAAARELLERTGFEIDEDKLSECGVITEEGESKMNSFALFSGKKSDLRKVANPGERGGYETEVMWKEIDSLLTKKNRRT